MFKKCYKYVFNNVFSSDLQCIKMYMNITHRTPWTERKTNAWVLDKIGNRLMMREMVRRRKLRFFGHVIRRKGLERTIITGKVNGKRKRGRPPTSWLKDIKSATGMTLQEAVRAAEDRERWRRIVKTTASHYVTSDLTEERDARMWWRLKCVNFIPSIYICKKVLKRFCDSNFVDAQTVAYKNNIREVSLCHDLFVMILRMLDLNLPIVHSKWIWFVAALLYNIAVNSKIIGTSFDQLCFFFFVALSLQLPNLHNLFSGLYLFIYSFINLFIQVSVLSTEWVKENWQLFKFTLI